MMRHLIWRVTALVLISGAAPGGIEAASFQPLGDLPGGDFYSLAWSVSADGSTVVGASQSARDNWEAFRWTQLGGMRPMGHLPDATLTSEARAVSSDGSVVAGQSISNWSGGAFRWTQAGGMEPLGDLPAGDFFDPPSRAAGVSADGSVIVGTGNYSRGGGPMPVTGEAFRWTELGGMAPLGDVPGGNGVSRALDVSADGSVIVGKGNAQASFQVEDMGVAFRWSAGEGMVGLGFLPGGSGLSAATAVSADGSVVVGYSQTASGVEAFRWTAGSRMVGLGGLSGPDQWLYSTASGVSADGSVIVGKSTSALGSEAFLWTAESGMRSFEEVLTKDFGLDLTGWHLAEVTDLSDDGNTIVGWGQNPSGNTEAWRAHIRTAEQLSVPDPAGGTGNLHRSFGFTGGARSLSVDMAYGSVGDLSVGVVSVEDLEPAAKSALEDYMAVGLFPQLWDVEFGGELSRATLVFHYDASALMGVDESSLVMWHFAEGRWSRGGTVDEEADTISLTVERFSPFSLGVVPEPSTFVLLGIGAVMLTAHSRRKRRRR